MGSPTGRSRDEAVLRRACAVDGCNGTMVLHERRQEATAPHTLEWPWYATWVCEQNPAHIQVIPHSEYAEIRRLLRRE